MFNQSKCSKLKSDWLMLHNKYACGIKKKARKDVELQAHYTNCNLLSLYTHTHTHTHILSVLVTFHSVNITIFECHLQT